MRKQGGDEVLRSEISVDDVASAEHGEWLQFAVWPQLIGREQRGVSHGDKMSELWNGIPY